MEILYNKEGTPLLLNSTYFFGETDQSFENAAKDKIKTLIPFPQRDKDYWVNLNDYKVMRWGENNDFPQLAVQQSALQCYTVEGAYPPNLEYLEENYGLRVNTTD